MEPNVTSIVNFTPDRRLLDTHCFTGTGIPVTSIHDYIALVCTNLMCINWPPPAAATAVQQRSSSVGNDDAFAFWLLCTFCTKLHEPRTQQRLLPLLVSMNRIMGEFLVRGKTSQQTVQNLMEKQLVRDAAAAVTARAEIIGRTAAKAAARDLLTEDAAGRRARAVAGAQAAMAAAGNILAAAAADDDDDEDSSSNNNRSSSSSSGGTSDGGSAPPLNKKKK